MISATDALVKSQFMEQFAALIDNESACASIEDLCSVFADGDWIESKDQSEDGIRLIQTGNVGNAVIWIKTSELALSARTPLIV